MGTATQHPPAALLLAAFSRYPAALAWAAQRAAQAWGDVALASPIYDFRETDYYQASMGPGLLKQFLVFDGPFDPGTLVERKLQSGDWERDYAALALHDEPRPLNLDPGYLTAAKLVLASTKDHAHRIYLAGGIYAEVTLHYQDRAWRHHPWTFPDYRRADYQQFFTLCRGWLRERSRRECTR